MLKPVILATLLAAASSSASAAMDFYVVVPVKGRHATPITDIVPVTVSLGSTSLAQGWVGDPYEFDFKSLLAVTGDSVFPSDAALTLAGGVLPSGLSLSNTGALVGTPSSAGTYNFAIRAAYGSASDQESYQITIAPAPVPATGAWSTSSESTTLSGTATKFAAQGTNTGSTKTVFLRNVGTTAELAASFQLVGDTAHFKLAAAPVTVSKTGLSAGSCASLNADATVSGACVAERADTGFYTHVKLLVTYLPKSAGTHSISLIPVSNNGAAMPAPLVFDGSSAEPSAAWSGALATASPPVTAFGTQSPMVSTAIQPVYLLNTSVAGSLAASFKLVGDVSEFKIAEAPKAVNAVGNKVSCGAAVASDSLSTSVCTSRNDSYKNIIVKVMYAPTGNGTHHVDLVPTTANGIVLPGALTFSGTANSVATGEWSASAASALALTTAQTDFGIKSAGQQVVTRTFYLRNTATTGSLASAFTLAGDTDQFKLTAVPLATNAGGSTKSCASSLSPDALTATTCTAEDALVAAYKHIKVQVQYAPSAVGSHTVRLKPVSTSGSSLPGEITLTGSAIQPRGAWSSAAGATTALTATSNSFGVQTSNEGSLTKTFYIRNTETTGVLTAGFTLAGDVSQFKIVSVQKASGVGGGAPCGAVISSDGASASTCTAQDVSGGSYPHMKIQISYTPTEPGAHSVELIPDAEGASGLPGPATLTGTSVFNAAGEWTAVYNGTTPATSAQKTYAATAIGASVTKTFYMYNTGSQGSLSAAFQISGDVSQFQLVAAPLKSNGVGNSTACGAALAADGLSTTACKSDNVAGGTYQRIRVQIKYAPTSVGSHSLTVTSSSGNGTVVPEALVLMGTGQ